MKKKYRSIKKAGLYDGNAGKKSATVSVNSNRLTELKRAEQHLMKIAKMGEGIPENMKDWSNIGKNAVFTAKEGLRAVCKTCGAFLKL